MLDIGSVELLLVAIIALLVVGPRDLPKLMRTISGWVAKARGTARHFKSGLDAMVRESEMEDMQKKWDAENAAIMRAHPDVPAAAAKDEGRAVSSGESSGKAEPDAP